MFEVAETGASLSKQELSELEPQLRVDLLNAQFDLQSSDFSVVVLLGGDDRPGCNAVLNLLHEWMDARWIATSVFFEPSEEEKERPRFWRYWRCLPPKGRIGLFLGAWATSAIASRLSKYIDEVQFQRRIEHVRGFEQQLVDEGAVILKLWLHLPKKEFKKRLKRAAKDPEKEWRVDEDDWAIFDDYGEVLDVCERYLMHTSTGSAPWNLVESTDERHRDATVASLLRDALVGALAGRKEPPHAPATPVSVLPSAPSVLQGVDLDSNLERDEYRERLDALQARLHGLSAEAGETGQSTVLVFEGWDAAGKGGVIRRLTGAMNARHYRVVPVAAPTQEELAQHWLWRFWRLLPRAGRVLIFDRSWYGRVLVERVEGLATPEAWMRAYAEIRAFEAQLCEHGYLLQKFWLHIDPDEQLRRFQAREKTPYKKYKITDEDYRNRERWDDYVLAIDDMVGQTSTRQARWHLVPANDKRTARVQVLETFCDGLERLLKSR